MSKIVEVLSPLSEKEIWVLIYVLTRMAGLALGFELIVFTPQGVTFRK